jgi:hypothetical protein
VAADFQYRELSGKGAGKKTLSKQTLKIYLLFRETGVIGIERE